MLQQIGTGIWMTAGPEVSVAGFRYPTRMAVIQLESGAVFIWSPVALTPELKSAVDRIGPVTHIAAPNHLHHLWIKDWQTAYPFAILHAAPRLQKKRRDLEVHKELNETPDSAWAEEIDQALMKGNLLTTEVVFFHKPSGTVLFTDLIQSFPKGWFRGWRGLIADLDRMTANSPTVPRKFRMAFVNRTAARHGLRKIKAWPTQNLLMAHGPLVARDAKSAVSHAFSWL